MNDSTGKQPLKGACAALAAAVLLAACASSPSATPPKLERLAASGAATAATPQATTLEDIAALAANGVGDEAIVARLKSQPTNLRLSAEQILHLAQRGVSAKVIDYLLERERATLFDEAAAEQARRDNQCQERIEQEVSRCRTQALPTWYLGSPTCWPPHPGTPYWRCF